MAEPRRSLAAERREVVRRLAALTEDLEGVVAASRDSNADDEHDPEGATIAFERSQIVSLVRQAQTHLGEVDAALGLLADGTYGICQRCGRPIGEARLDARPRATTCIGCAT